jgi:hypothetical protein
MNPRLGIIIALQMALALTVARAQNYGLDWSTTTGGGGTSTAGVYTVTGTIARPDTGRLNSSDFAIAGGFWSIVAAIQEPGAPMLSLRHTQTNSVIISWPMTWQGFELLENPEITTTNWTRSATQPVVVITGPQTSEKQVVVRAPSEKRFYRLNKQ